MNHSVLLFLCGAVLFAIGWLVVIDLRNGKKFRLDLAPNKQKSVLTPKAVWLRFSVQLILFAYLFFAAAFRYHSPVLVAVSLLALGTSIMVLTISLKKLRTANKDWNSESAS
jgi:cell division protein FtsW (lipid II flippase)